MTKLSTPSTSVVVDEAPGVVASAAQINQWAENAKAGDRFVYASRSSLLPRGSEGGRTARDLLDRGLVRHEQRRIAAGSINYAVIRTSKPWEVARPTRRERTGPAISGEAAAVDALFPILVRFARFNRPCPTDAQLAGRAGVTLDVVKPALAAMQIANMIRIKGVKAPTLRIVEICGTGHITGMIG